MDTLEELTEEKEQLDARIARLNEFFASDRFTIVPGAGQARMTLQSELMLKYSEVLGERIRLFNEDEATGEEKQEGVEA